MIRLIALLILGSALASCARGTYEANVGKVVDMIERSRCRGIEVVAAVGESPRHPRRWPARLE
jgi:hypothetical protein